MGVERSAAVYVHFPFCLTKCRYCDFSSRAVRREGVPHDAYARAVMNEWAARARGPMGGMEVPALFFGGGTPSLWSPRDVGRVIEAVMSGRGNDVEVSLEANPGAFGEREAVGYRSAGVTRLSVGVQALAERRLGILGTKHEIH